LGIDVLATDIDGDNLNDVICGKWWYKNPTWQRYEIPYIFQIICAYDIDNDGVLELIALKGDKLHHGSDNKSDLCWLKPIDPQNNKWVEYPIGIGVGDWPQGATVAPLFPNGNLSLIVCYNGANMGMPHFPEIFEIPADPKESPWKKKFLVELLYGGEPVPCDINGDGKLDLVLGKYWLENLGDGNFKTRRMVGEEDIKLEFKIWSDIDGNFKTSRKVEDFIPARVCITDINNNGRPDVIIGEEIIDFDNKITPYSRIAWFENPGNNFDYNWKMHTIDTLRCPHSLGIADLDQDGEMEIICGEHDPFFSYRNKCRLIVYKKAEVNGRAWKSYTIDNRFEHFNGAKPIKLNNNKIGIISHSWTESKYLHLWEI